MSSYESPTGCAFSTRAKLSFLGCRLKSSAIEMFERRTWGCKAMVTTTNAIPVRLNEVHAGYGRKEVLWGVSANVASGQIVAFIGPNGAGKSTILDRKSTRLNSS